MNPKLLLVDDEPAIVEAIENSLSDEAYTIYKAGCAAEALDVLEHHAVDIVITDQSMPGMSGTDLCSTVHERWPSTYRILLSSSPDHSGQNNQNGDIHQYMDKPWDALQLRYNINEGIRQQQILQQSLELQRTFQQPDQAFLITDRNWVITLANGAWQQWLGLENYSLSGMNLFSHKISQNSVQQEAQLMSAVETTGCWQGCFLLNTDSMHGQEAWMCIVPLANQHYLCMAIPMNDGMALSNPDKDERLQDYFLIETESNLRLNLDFNTLVNEHLQEQLNFGFQVLTTSSGAHLIPIADTINDGELDQIQQKIEAALDKEIMLHEESQLAQWRINLISESLASRMLSSSSVLEPALKPITTEQDRANNTGAQSGSQYHTYYLAHHIRPEGYHCRPFFNQDGQCIGLIPSPCNGRGDIEQWLKNTGDCANEWANYCERPLIWISDFSQLKPHQLFKALAPVLIMNQHSPQDWWLMLTDEQIREMLAADKKTLQQLERAGMRFMMLIQDHSITRVNDLIHELPGLLKGLSYSASWLLTPTGGSIRHAQHLMSSMIQKGLTLYCHQLSQPETLAAIHASNTHWLSGDMLSPTLSPEQICWLHQ